MYNAKNYTEQGGAVTHIGGSLIIEDGATVTGLPQGVAVANAAGSAPTAAEFKALLDSLRDAGIIATST